MRTGTDHVNAESAGSKTPGSVTDITSVGSHPWDAGSGIGWINPSPSIKELNLKSRLWEEKSV